MSSVDVIVPCYRYGCYLRQCVESVLRQDGLGVRVLIIDDASPDNTSEIAEALARLDGRVEFRRHTSNRGHIATYNEGIEWASSRYLLVLSADDYLLPGALARAARLLDAHPEVGFAFGKAIRWEEGTDPLPVNGAVKSGSRIWAGSEFIERSGAQNVVPTPTAVVRTSMQKRVGGYRTELPHSGDMEMFLRLAAHSSVGVLEAAQAVYRRHSRNMSHEYLANLYLPDLLQRKAALDCFFETCAHLLAAPDELRNRKMRSLARHTVGYASQAFNAGDMEKSEMLSQFALGLCPGIQGSWAWFLLGCKRLVGTRVWRAVGPVVDRLRGNRGAAA